MPKRDGLYILQLGKIPSPLLSPVKYQCRKKKWHRFRRKLGLILDTSGWQATQMEQARTTYTQAPNGTGRN